MMLLNKSYRDTLGDVSNQKVAIIGKNANIEKYMPLDLSRFDVVVCLNGIINYMDRCDWLVMCDTVAIDEVNDKGKANVRRVFIPEYPHLPDCTHEEFMEKFGVSCEYMIFDSHFTPKPNKNILRLDHVFSVADTALQFMLWLGYRKFEFYGLGTTPETFSAFNEVYMYHGWKETPQELLGEVESRLLEWLYKYKADVLWHR